MFIYTGLVLLLIPIIIHFFSRKKKRTEEWSAMYFLEVAWKKKKSIIKIKNIFLLFLRILCVFLLSLVFSDVRLKEYNLKKRVYLVVDNTASISTGDKEDTKEKLYSYLQKINNTEFKVISGSKPAGYYESDWLVDTDRVIETVFQIPETLMGEDILSAISFCEKKIKQKNDGFYNEIIFVGPWRGCGDIVLKSTTKTSFIGVSSEHKRNISIKEIKPLSDFIWGHGLETNLSGQIKISNEGLNEEVTRVALKIKKQGDVFSKKINLLPKEEKIITYNTLTRVPVSDFLIEARIGLDDNIKDNIKTKPIRRRVLIKTLILSGNNYFIENNKIKPEQWLEVLFKTTNKIQSETITTDRFNNKNINDFDFIFITEPNDLNKEDFEKILKYTTNGGSALVFPSIKNNTRLIELFDFLNLNWTVEGVVSSSSGFSLTVENGEFFKKILEDLDVLSQPVKIFKHTVFKNTPVENTILSVDNKPLLFKNPTGQGSLLFFSTPLNDGWTNIVSKPMFVPLFLEIIRESVSKKQKQIFVGDFFKSDGPWVNDNKIESPVFLDNHFPDQEGWWENRLGGRLWVDIEPLATNTTPSNIKTDDVFIRIQSNGGFLNYFVLLLLVVWVFEGVLSNLIIKSRF